VVLTAVGGVGLGAGGEVVFGFGMDMEVDDKGLSILRRLGVLAAGGVALSSVSCSFSIAYS
jgi:hypothetical protein